MQGRAEHRNGDAHQGHALDAHQRRHRDHQNGADDLQHTAAGFRQLFFQQCDAGVHTLIQGNHGAQGAAPHEGKTGQFVRPSGRLCYNIARDHLDRGGRDKDHERDRRYQLVGEQDLVLDGFDDFHSFLLLYASGGGQ